MGGWVEWMNRGGSLKKTHQPRPDQDGLLHRPRVCEGRHNPTREGRGAARRLPRGPPPRRLHPGRPGPPLPQPQPPAARNPAPRGAGPRPTVGGRQPSARMSAWNSSMKRADSARGSSPASFALGVWGAGGGPRQLCARRRGRGALSPPRGDLQNTKRDPQTKGQVSRPQNGTGVTGYAPSRPPVDDFVVHVCEVPHVIHLIPQQLSKDAVQHVKGHVHARVAWGFGGLAGSGAVVRPTATRLPASQPAPRADPQPRNEPEAARREAGPQPAAPPADSRNSDPGSLLTGGNGPTRHAPTPHPPPTNVAVVVHRHPAHVHLQPVTHGRPRPQPLLAARHRVV